MGLLDNVTGKELSVIKDPFNKTSVTGISLRYSLGPPDWRGGIDFKNGNTSGHQDIPTCQTFEEAVAQIKLILDSVNH